MVNYARKYIEMLDIEIIPAIREIVGDVFDYVRFQQDVAQSALRFN